MNAHESFLPDMAVKGYTFDHKTGTRSCAWCQAERGIIPEAGESHGICERHRQGVLREAEEMRGEYPALARAMIEMAEPGSEYVQGYTDGARDQLASRYRGFVWDQIVLSAVVLAVAFALGVAVGCAAAGFQLWRGAL